MKTKLLPFAALSLAIIVWGMDAIAIEMTIKNGITELFLAFARIAIAFVVFATLHFIFKRGERIKMIHWKNLIISGVCGMGIYWFLENKGIAHTSGALASVILAAIPVLGLLGDRIVFGAKLTARRICAIAACVIGTYIVVTGAPGAEISGTINGLLFMIAAAICWTLYIIFSKTLLQNYSIITVLMYQTLIGTVILAPMSIGSWPEADTLTGQTIGLILFMGFICTCVAEFAYQIAINGLSVTIVSAFESLVPVFAIIIGYIVFKETLSLQQFMGGAVIILAVMAISITPKTKKLN